MKNLKVKDKKDKKDKDKKDKNDKDKKDKKICIKNSFNNTPLLGRWIFFEGERDLFRY